VQLVNVLARLAELLSRHSFTSPYRIADIPERGTARSDIDNPARMVLSLVVRSRPPNVQSAIKIIGRLRWRCFDLHDLRDGVAELKLVGRHQVTIYACCASGGATSISEMAGRGSYLHEAIRAPADADMPFTIVESVKTTEAGLPDRIDVHRTCCQHHLVKTASSDRSVYIYTTPWH
jgi:hypothetical protein